MKDYKQNFCFDIKESYNSFRKKLEESIKNNGLSLNNSEYYLINDTYNKELKNNLDRIESIVKYNLNKLNTIEKKDITPQRKLDFINEISKVIDLLNNKSKFSLFSKELMIQWFDINFLRKYNTVNYFCGNNLLIIEFKKATKYGLEITSLLIINPLDIDNNYNNSLFFPLKIKEKERLEIYKQLLSNKSLFNLQINILNNNSKNYIDFGKILDLKKISYFFKVIKEFYNYKEIQDFLKDNNFVNYSNSDGNYEIILNSYLDKYPNLIYSKFPENLMNYKEIKPSIIEYENPVFAFYY